MEKWRAACTVRWRFMCGDLCGRPVCVRGGVRAGVHIAFIEGTKEEIQRSDR